MNNELNTKIRRILSYDAMQEAERFTGKDSSTSEETMNLGLLLHLRSVKTKRNLLKTLNDTFVGISKGEYKMRVSDFGFKELLRLDFFSLSSKEVESFYIMWKDGILMCYDTFMGKINSAHIYFNYLQHFNLKTIFDSGVLDHVSGSWRHHENVWLSDHFREQYGFYYGWNKNADDRFVKIGSLDCREGLLFHIKNMLEYGEFLQTWIERPFLWLLHHMDTKNPNYDYNKINKERISLLPKEVINAISPKEDF